MLAAAITSTSRYAVHPRPRDASIAGAGLDLRARLDGREDRRPIVPSGLDGARSRMSIAAAISRRDQAASPATSGEGGEPGQFHHLVVVRAGSLQFDLSGIGDQSLVDLEIAGALVTFDGRMNPEALAVAGVVKRERGPRVAAAIGVGLMRPDESGGSSCPRPTGSTWSGLGSGRGPPALSGLRDAGRVEGTSSGAERPIRNPGTGYPRD
jgi:hypothetical protein